MKLNLMKKVTFLLMAVSLFNMTAWAQPPSAFAPRKPASAPISPAATAPAQPAPEKDPVEEWIGKASLATRIAQLMIVTIEGGNRLNLDETALFKTAMPGGVIIRQSKRPELAAACAQQLRMYEQASGVPCLIGADYYELSAPGSAGIGFFPEMPTLLALAAANDPEVTRSAGDVLASYIGAIGFNFSLGPPLSLAPTASEAKGTVHCFGSNPKFAAEAGAIFCESFRNHFVEPMPMGFPGGAFNRTGKGTSVLTTARAALADSDMLPFAEAVRGGARMINIGTTLVPTIDSGGMPACLSDVVINDLLRRELKYEGIIVCGPMDSETVSSLMDSAKAAAAALERGADMIYWHSGPAQAARTIEFLVQAVGRGDLSEEAVNVTVRKIVRFKTDRIKQPVPDKKETSGEKAIAKLNDLPQLVQSVNRHSITLAQHRKGTLPLTKENALPVGITGTVGVEELYNALEKPLKKVMMQPIATASHIGDIQRFEIQRLTSNMGKLNTLICILTDQERPQGQAELVRELRGHCVRLVVIFLGYPSRLDLFSEADVILLGYSLSSSTTETMAVMADTLLGKGALGFAVLPEILHLKVGEERTFSIADTVQTPPGHLPVDLNETVKAGYAGHFNPETAVKKTEWDFAGKRIGKPSTLWKFDQPGEYPVTLNITDTRGETRSKTFTVKAE